jgi:hypothetical protein
MTIAMNFFQPGLIENEKSKSGPVETLMDQWSSLPTMKTSMMPKGLKHT